MGDLDWSSMILKDAPYTEGTQAGAGLTLEKFMKDCPLQEGPHTGAQEEGEEEEVAETKHEVTAVPIL